MIEVVAGIIKKDGRVFIAKRSLQKDLSGYWEFPGGKVETNESPEEALKREFKEEFDLEIIVKEEFHQNIHEYPSKIIQLKSYFAEALSENIRIKDHEEVKWVPIKELDKFQFSPADIPIVKKLQSQSEIKRAYYSDEVSFFQLKSNNEILGQLISNHTNRTLEDLQRNAWIKQIDVLKKALKGFDGKLYFEFAIPRMGKRVDNILIVKDCFFVG